MIQSSKDFGIDLNTKDIDGWTTLHWACECGETETVQIMMKHWKEFGIDIKSRNNEGKTALDLIDEEDGHQIMKMLENEYSQFDVTFSVQSRKY